MCIPGQWLEIILILSSFATGYAFRPRAVVQSDKSHTGRLLPVAQNGSLANATTILSSNPSLHNIGLEHTSTTGTNREQHQNVSSSKTLRAGNPKYVCNGAAYGRNLNLQSCLEAIDSIRVSDLPKSFGQRDKGKWDVNLPFRFLGHDGLCAIDISLRAGEDFETIVTSDMKLHIQALFEICVHTSPNQGGIVTNLGQNGALAIRIVPYRPRVQCKEPGSAPPAMTCREILDLMPTDGKQRRFGPHDDPIAEILLPKKFATHEARCVLSIDTTLNSDVTDWYKLWAAALAVEVMCVEANGAGGVAFGLGKDRNLTVELWDHAWNPSLQLATAGANLSAPDVAYREHPIS